jgi:hypothetical protein
MNLIRNIIEPTRLVLAWKPPETIEHDRKNRIIAELIKDSNDVVEFRYLTESEDFAEAIPLGLEPYPAFPKFEKVYSNDIVETFMRRLPPRNRNDFARYMEALRLPLDAQVSDFALLGYSEAKLPSDNYFIVNPLDDIGAPCEFITEIAGVRYWGGPNMNLEIGSMVNLIHEPDNPKDDMAVKVEIQNKIIGYISRLQLNAFHRWLKDFNLKAYIERKNGRPERLRLFLFVSVN